MFPLIKLLVMLSLSENNLIYLFIFKKAVSYNHQGNATYNTTLASKEDQIIKKDMADLLYQD